MPPPGNLDDASLVHRNLNVIAADWMALEARASRLLRNCEARAATQSPRSETDAELEAELRGLCDQMGNARLSLQTLCAQLVPNGDARCERVLVVDDSDDNRQMTALVLQDAGFDVATAANGLEGVLLATAIAPCVILMDLEMPVLDGFEAARLLRARAQTRHLPVIAYTAAQWDRVGDYLFSFVLRKPVAPTALLHAVKHFAARGHA